VIFKTGLTVPGPADSWVSAQIFHTAAAVLTRVLRFEPRLSRVAAQRQPRRYLQMNTFYMNPAIFFIVLNASHAAAAKPPENPGNAAAQKIQSGSGQESEPQALMIQVERDPFDRRAAFYPTLELSHPACGLDGSGTAHEPRTRQPERSGKGGQRS
jgi:hypothetical protein